jgi:tetratricopeptide (TPR) repeat protein
MGSIRAILPGQVLPTVQVGHNVSWTTLGARSHALRIAATSAALVVVGLAVFLLARNQPIADPKLFFVLRVALSFSTATLGATIPGFLNIRWSGGGMVLRAGGALALFALTYVYTPDLVAEKAQTTQNAPGGVIANSITNSPITIVNQGDNAELLRQGKATQDLIRQLLAQSPAQAAPGAEKRVGEAVSNIARGAAEGDERLRKALDLLRAGKVADAVPLLQAVAEDKTARIRQDSQVAAVAFRNLGAIAGLADPKQARVAYAEAVRLDPNNREGTLWHGYLEADAGNLAEAETAYRRVVSLGAPGKDDWALCWAHLGPGDVQVAHGGLTAAMGEYELGRAIADGVAKSDPGNAGWQRDLSVSFDKVGDVLVAQGNLPEALKSTRHSLTIRDRLAKSDPGNAGWQYDLGISNERIGEVLVAQGDLPEALNSYRTKFAIIDRLAQIGPGQRRLAARSRVEPRSGGYG